jgi:hypothetical protein
MVSGLLRSSSVDYDRRAFGVGVVTGGLACAGLAIFAVFQTRTAQTNSYPTASIQATVPEEFGVYEWEYKNLARYNLGELNEAQLGMANLEHAMQEPSLMAEVADWLRHPEGRASLLKTMNDQKFQADAKDAAAQMKKGGELPNFLTFDFYSESWNADKNHPSKTQARLTQALEAASAFRMPAAATSRPTDATRQSDVKMDAMADLKSDAKKLNPAIGFFDPLGLSEGDFWGQGNEATIGFLRHAEIKHGRVAMAGFVGYCFHENGIHFPVKPFNLESYDGLSAPALWDATPAVARFQILLTIGFFEWWSERSDLLEREGQKHYMRGGKPGFFPSFQEIPEVPLNLWDPFGYAGKLSDEAKSKKLLAEVNNGRLAMLGLMSLLAEAKTPGATPALAGLIKKYDGIIMNDPWGFGKSAPFFVQ